jgi:hypothetical protein
MHEALEAVAIYVEAECRHLHARYLMNVAALDEVRETILTRVVADIARSRARRPLKMRLTRQAAKAAGSRR